MDTTHSVFYYCPPLGANQNIDDRQWLYLLSLLSPGRVPCGSAFCPAPSHHNPSWPHFRGGDGVQCRPDPCIISHPSSELLDLREQLASATRLLRRSTPSLPSQPHNPSSSRHLQPSQINDNRDASYTSIWMHVEYHIAPGCSHTNPHLPSCAMTAPAAERTGPPSKANRSLPLVSLAVSSIGHCLLHSIQSTILPTIPFPLLQL